MARNRRPEAEAEAEAQDGSFSEEEESHDLEESSDSESEQEKASTPIPKKPSAPQSQPQPSSSEESEPESDSEPDSPPSNTRRPDPPNIKKPIASKPMKDPPTSTTKKSTRSKPTSATPATTAVVKRAAEVGGSRDSKRAKMTGDVDDVKKKQLFQRLWSEDDEIVILKGMIDYTAEKKGTDPMADINGFHDFIKKSLHVEASNGQLLNKLRKLRKKYMNNAGKEKDGQDRAFSKAHEQKSYDLSKKLWGGEGNGIGVDRKKGSGKLRKNREENVAEPKVDGLVLPEEGTEWTKMEVELNKGAIGWSSRRIGGWGLEGEIVKEGLELIGGQKKLELEEKWKQFRVEEVKLYLKRLDLIHEETTLVLEALKPQEH